MDAAAAAETQCRSRRTTREGERNFLGQLRLCERRERQGVILRDREGGLGIILTYTRARVRGCSLAATQRSTGPFPA